MSTLFNITQSLPRCWIGPVSDSTYNVELNISKLVYPRLGLRNTWIPYATNEDDEMNNSSISDLAFSRDGKTLVASSADQNVYVFDANSGELTNTLKQAHSSPVTRVCCIGESQFVSGSEDSTIALWDLRKATEPVNRLQGHSSSVRSLDFNTTSDLLISSSMDQHVRYWHIPTFQTKRDDQNVDSSLSSSFRGIVVKCPDLTHVCMHQDGTSLVLVNSRSTFVVVYNLDIIPLSEKVKSIRFDDSIAIQLSWINPNSSMTRKNRIRVLVGDDYCPVGQGSVSKVSSIQFHPTLPLVMARLSMNQTFPLNIGRQTTEWSCAITLKQSILDTPSNFVARKSYGSDVLDETLLFFKEERKSGIIERRHSFSKCGRVIASPGKEHVTLLTFSPDYNEPYDNKTNRSTMYNLFMNTFSPSRSSELTTVGGINVPGQVISCAKFSPFDILLAIGARSGHVSVYKPVI